MQRIWDMAISKHQSVTDVILIMVRYIQLKHKL